MQIIRTGYRNERKRRVLVNLRQNQAFNYNKRVLSTWIAETENDPLGVELEI